MVEFTNFKNKNIVITGTSCGIGYELAKKFLKSGNYVWGCSKSKSKIKYKNYFHQRLDLSNFNKLKNWVKNIKIQSSSNIDILILNAAYYERTLNYFENDENINRTISINLTSSAILCREISKIMIQNKSGNIFFFSSSAVAVKDEGTSSYAASKAGLEMFSQVLSKELQKFGINIFIFRINFIKTRLSKNMKVKEINNLLKKFKTNIFFNTNAIYKKLINCYINKKKNKILIYDQLK